MEFHHGIVDPNEYKVRVVWKMGIESNSKFFTLEEAEKYKKYVEEYYANEIVSAELIIPPHLMKKDKTIINIMH